MKIKYKAWDKEEQRIITPSLFDLGIYAQNITIDGLFEDSRFIFMQYTGLKDKNGVEIYEGYIIKGMFNIDNVADYIYLGLSESEKKTGIKIFYVEDIFYLYTHPIPDNIEIIGNIYENPNLLKQVSE